MSPALGRFLQRDPSKFKQTWISLYSYTNNAPVVRTDPLGLHTNVQKYTRSVYGTIFRTFGPTREKVAIIELELYWDSCSQGGNVWVGDVDLVESPDETMPFTQEDFFDFVGISIPKVRIALELLEVTYDVDWVNVSKRRKVRCPGTSSGTLCKWRYKRTVEFQVTATATWVVISLPIIGPIWGGWEETAVVGEGEFDIFGPCCDKEDLR